jgi:hypothetical protein
LTGELPPVPDVVEGPVVEPPVPAPELLLVELLVVPEPPVLVVVLVVVEPPVPDGVHVPLVHVPPGQGVPSGLLGLEQPLVGLHVPASWQASMAVQLIGAPPPQVPCWHVWSVTHMLPVEHAVPSAATGVEHMPLVGSQTPAVWQAVGWGQATGLPPVHTPDWQVSVWLHRLPSLQAVPSGLAGLVQPVAGAHVPAVWH